MAILPPRELLAAARAQGEGALRNIAPIALAATLVEGYDPSDPRTLLEPSVTIAPVPHPLLDALLTVSHATRRGRMTWSVGMGEDFDASPLYALFDHVAEGTICGERIAKTSRGPKQLREIPSHARINSIEEVLRGTPAAVIQTAERRARWNRPHPGEGAAAYAGVCVSTDGRSLYIKFVTNELAVHSSWDAPPVNLNLRPAGRPLVEPKPLYPAEAIAVLEWATAQGFEIVDPSEDAAIATLRRKVATSLVAWPTPGRPAMATVSVGRSVFKSAGRRLPLPAPGPGRASSRGQMTAEDVAALARTLESDKVCLHRGVADAGVLALAEPVVDERLRGYQCEAVGLHVATTLGYVNCVSPGMGKTVITLDGMRRRSERLPGWRGLVVAEANVRKQWFDEAAIWFPTARVVRVESRKDATMLRDTLAEAGLDPVLVVVSYGLLASVKTVLDRWDADGFRPEEFYPLRGGQIRPQTTGEQSAAAVLAEAEAIVEAAAVAEVAATLEVVESATVFAPIEGRHGQLDLFALLLEEPAPAPDPVVSEQDEQSGEPEAAPAVGEVEERDADLGEVILSVFWDDLVADEAEVLRGTGAGQAHALWVLRDQAEVAVALTGTPINRGVDDLGRLLAWVRADRHLFTGVKLSTSFDLNDDDDLAEFTRAVGKLVFRRDTSEISDELPKIKAIVEQLTPSVAEKALASAARNELKRVYDELMAWLQMVEATDPENPDYAQARESLTAARGAWLGGTTLARMASSDPAALIGSQSAGAALLASQGLIAAALEQRGTKRARVVDMTVERVAAGRKVLIFTEFATVARGLIEDLDAAGVRVGEVLGGGGRKRDAYVAAFQAGELDVLVCTASGERGLNLQMANTVVHYDLPWTPKGVIQRTGRARRIRATSQEVEVIFPIMTGTIEERVAAMVVSRAVESMRALDSSRGVDVADTEMGLALAGLVGAVSSRALSGKDSTQLEMTRELLAS